ncbi:hypothetical protein PV08_01184 [Exophiala spinifera]|uniref:Azaphilone pigments biosynthesis cluster protein L N-terminal domain-containing protein n=1 Tax=Exophiala spinifera TaxID=91928 RepID=A0A0D2CAL4_9EURO|nr:uncharacterized protein PV08_01184 [Exophiala spinifera]KIW20609.1 hypothetical protein PV08_01184 [Exophiala spinifera]
MPILAEVDRAISAAIEAYQFIQRYRRADKEIQELGSDILALTAVLDSIATVCETTPDSKCLDALRLPLITCSLNIKTLKDRLPDSAKERNGELKSPLPFLSAKFAREGKTGLDSLRRSLLECKAILKLALSNTQLRFQNSLDLNSAEMRQAQDEVRPKLRGLEPRIAARDADSDAQIAGYDGRDEPRPNEDEEAGSGHALKKYRLQLRERPENLNSPGGPVNDQTSNTRQYSGNSQGMLARASTNPQRRQPVSRGYSDSSESVPRTPTRTQHQHSDAETYSGSSRGQPDSSQRGIIDGSSTHYRRLSTEESLANDLRDRRRERHPRYNGYP